MCKPHPILHKSYLDFAPKRLGRRDIMDNNYESKTKEIEINIFLYQTMFYTYNTTGSIWEI